MLNKIKVHFEQLKIIKIIAFLLLQIVKILKYLKKIYLTKIIIINILDCSNSLQYIENGTCKSCSTSPNTNVLKIPNMS